MNNKIYFSRKQKIYISKTTKKNTNNNLLVLTLLKNIESLGYILSKEIINILLDSDVSTIVKFNKELVDTIKKSIGAHVKYRPMYPNFPEQVMNMDEAELYINALIHYFGDWIGVKIVPKYKKKKRPKLETDLKLKMIKLGTKKEFNSIFTNLISSKISLLETDKEDINWFVTYYKNKIDNFLPNEIPLKENIAYVGSLLKKNNVGFYKDFLNYNIKTATDLLRYIVSTFDGDVSLAENTRFGKICRKDRRLYLSILDSCFNITEDMLRYKEQWKRLGERLHPSEYYRYKKANKSFDILRNDLPFKTFNSKIESAIVSKKVKDIVELVSQRPGDFARKLDRIIREVRNKQTVVDAFSDIAEQVASPLLLQLKEHFQNRNKLENRVVFPKGNVSKVFAIENVNYKPIKEDITKKIISVCKKALVKKFKVREPLGNVYIDKTLKNYTVPFKLNTASKQLKTISRGSSIDIPEGNIIRNFIWWKEEKNDRVDVDLTVSFYDDNFYYEDYVSYTNLKTDGCCHSGDFTSGPASEFVDIDINKMIERSIRYGVMQIYAYTQQPFCDMPECFGGFMIRKNMNSGEIFEPKTVLNKWDLTSNTKTAIPIIFDFIERKMIWVDISLSGSFYNFESNSENVILMLKSMLNLNKPNLYELFYLNAKARGNIINNKKDADIIFSEIGDVKPTDIDKIISDYV